MAVAVGGLQTAIRRLEILRPQLLPTLERGLIRAVEPTRQLASALAPRGTQPIPSKGRNRHTQRLAESIEIETRNRSTIRTSAVGARVMLISRQPHSAVQNWGGTIEPKGTAITITGRHFADRAAEQTQGLIAEGVEREFDGLFRTSGL
jgi:hypothetical protein